MPYRFQQLLRNIGEECERAPLTEAEVEKIFQQHDFFVELGYEGIGRDILAQRSRKQKRYDTALTGFGGRVRAVIEFKKPGTGDLEDFADDLYGKYVRPHSANIGVLTDGIELVLYFRVNGDFAKQFRFRLVEVTEGQAHKLDEILRKRRVDLERLPSVLDWLRENVEGRLPIRDSESEPAKIFFQVFQLRPESAFGRLTLALWEILPQSIADSGFTQGSYEFWLKTYARELKLKDVPQSWKAFALTDSVDVIARFSFALETAYTIISRLVLAKAADDRRFPHVRFLPRLHESYSELSTRDRLRPEHHLEVADRTFKRAGDVLFHSIFSQDIFDWWVETKTLNNRVLCLALGEAVLTVAQFYFAELSGDLLGDLYQHYFDRDTRKALGEFYTPAEAIEFILDECGYKGQRAERLLDPACGSGSFLVAALKRYLGNQKGREREPLLRDLTEGLRIVGFDINPFAVLMSQVNYAALILPLYAEAVYRNPDFRILRLPVFRTDSLRIEEREVEQDKGKKDKLTINMRFEEKTLDISVYLPLLEGKKRFVPMPVKVPRFVDARAMGLVGNLEDYVAALGLVFQAARDTRTKLAALLKDRFGERAKALATYLQDALDGLNATVQLLKGKYNDGRFLKTIEDLVLAVSLKHDLQYDYVVGNPPYVRIQKIPEHVKEYWDDKYEWTEHNYDLYIPFFERSVQAAGQSGWLKDGGKLGFIVSDRFLNVDYGETLREKLPEKLRVDLLIDFRDTRVFEEALNYPAILIGEKVEKGRDGEMEGARVFASDATFSDLSDEFFRLRESSAKRGVARGRAMEVFGFPRERLRSDGWWLMPRDERAVFDKLRGAEGRRRLTELTSSSSGAFQGLATGSDEVLVFDSVENLGVTLLVRARHKPDRCGCRDKPLEIEKDALRPFLFGRDVARWLIDWKKTWVMFPYDVYAKKETLYDEKGVKEDWNLVPSKENLAEFGFANPDEIETIEKRFPKAWDYLKKHETVLRGREHGRYEKGKKDGVSWYGAARPQNLDYYFRPKLVLQINARRNSFANDAAGTYVFQAGGKGGGVYGIVFDSTSQKQVRALQCVLNSKVSDFLIKQVSSVYGGRFYSYGDQFLRDLPMAEEALKVGVKGAKLERLADSVSVELARRGVLVRKVSEFPESFAGALPEYELESIEQLADKQPTSEQLKIELDAVRVEATLYGFSVEFGAASGFEFQTWEHAECLAEALRNHGRAGLTRSEVLSWRLPARPEGCRKLLGVLEAAKREVESLKTRIRSEEDKADEIVYEMYRVTKQERKVIEDFLERYSSVASADGEQESIEGVAAG